MDSDLYRISLQFDPSALRLARELRGLQKNELAAQIGVTASALTQFEGGVSRPSPQTIGKLSLCLQFPPTFFQATSEGSSISSEECHFRRLQSSSQSERRKMVALATLLSRLTELLEEYVDFPPEQLSGTQMQPPSDLHDIEATAVRIREHWGLGMGPIPHVVALLESKGIITFRLLDDCKRVDAFSLWLRNRPFIFLNAEKGSASRSRFDAAHELGHLVMHSDCKPGDSVHEMQADRFASAFLLPRPSFITECPRRLSWDHYLALKQRWGVSLQALIRRSFDLGCIGEHTYRRAYVQLNQKGWRAAEPNEPATEQPMLIQQSITLLKQIAIDLPTVANKLSVREHDLRLWIDYQGHSEPSFTSTAATIVPLEKSGNH
ncbi:MAG: ImmA/IrrE family metallo-endopeptidase [Candidatus Melainabacteria bacterium]|nr:ImmA/IrrE family metallo-endopeptidase [Candidatus Melainabacteria bacterium]